jgi:hypothetical protein
MGKRGPKFKPAGTLAVRLNISQPPKLAAWLKAEGASQFVREAVEKEMSKQKAELV